MIYDRLLTVFKLDTASSALARKLLERSRHLCAYRTVYHRTYFQAVQAGQRIERMVQIPTTDTPPDATMYAELEDGQIYKITEAQFAEDEDGLPCIVLALTREEARYELFRA